MSTYYALGSMFTWITFSAREVLALFLSSSEKWGLESLHGLPKITSEKGWLASYLGEGLNKLLFLLGINHPSKKQIGDFCNLQRNGRIQTIFLMLVIFSGGLFIFRLITIIFILVNTNIGIIFKLVLLNKKKS